MYKIKKLKSELDLQQSLDIRFAVFVNEQNVPKELEIDNLDKDKNTIHIGVFDNNKMVATGRILNAGSSNIHLGRIAVLKDYRGLGIGKKLVLEMERISQKLINNDIVSHISSQLNAEKFYLSLGYKRVNNNIYLDAGIEHIDMIKNINYKKDY